MYIAFLDEFGHVGPFVSRTDKRYKDSPVFGLAGFIIPHKNVRHFAIWFFKQKGFLFKRQIRNLDVDEHPATWERKGSKIFTTKNVMKKENIRRMGFRLLNKVRKLDGHIFYYGRQKYQSPERSNASGLYTTVLAESIRRLDRFCDEKDQHFLIILDEHSDRRRLLTTSTKTMFGADSARKLIEPPLQVESHLYQTIQAADWIATLVGRLLAHRAAPAQYYDWQWAEKYYGRRITQVTTHSSLWRPQ